MAEEDDGDDDDGGGGDVGAGKSSTALEAHAPNRIGATTCS
jgi:hypothetical protein